MAVTFPWVPAPPLCATTSFTSPSIDGMLRLSITSFGRLVTSLSKALWLRITFSGACRSLSQRQPVHTFLMSTLPPIVNNEDEIQAPQRPPTPPFHVTFAARGLHVRQVLQVTGTCPTSLPYRHKTFPHINRATFEYLLRKP